MDHQDVYRLKQTRLNLEPLAASAVVNIEVPSPNGVNSKRARPKGEVDSPDATFKYENLATASSIFYRPYHEFPRCFLWRVLEGNTVLVVRPVDLCKEEKEPEASLTLVLHFPQPILPSCVSFADAKDQDVLNIFVLDQANYLCSISLRSDVFRRRDAVEAAKTDACKFYLSSGFGFRHPHRLVAESAERLVVTLHDGGLIKFERNKHFHAAGTQWKETFYNVTGWAQGIRSLLPFQGKQTVKYGRVNMELTAAASVVSTSLGLDDGSFLFTVCVDHRMRVWNLKSGQILYTGDILNADRDMHEVGRWIIDPSQGNLVRVVGRTEGVRLCVTYSPLGNGAFKFWRVQAADSDTLSVQDMFPDEELVPMAPSSPDVWTLADFAVEERSGAVELWALWKNNMTYRVQKLAFADDDIKSAWKDGWVAVVSETPVPPAATSGPNDPTDVAEKWLQLVFYPGRFTRPTLETALAIYERSLGMQRNTSSRNQKGLAELISTTLASTAALERTSLGEMNYDQYRATSEIQWRRFYRLLVELDKQRGEALSFAVDEVLGMTWVVCADSLSAVSGCSQLEQLQQNYAPEEEGLQKPFALINAAFNFVDGFSDSMLQICNAILRSELFEDSSKTDYERIQYFSDKTGFWRQVTEDDCSAVVKALGQNFNVVSIGLYQETLRLILATDNARNRSIQYPLTDFGKKLVVRSVQETAEFRWKFCFSQLILLVHMAFEFEQDEDALYNRIDIGAVFRQLVTSLRRLELLLWLSRNELSIPIVRPDRAIGLSDSHTLPKRPYDDVQVATVFEASVGHLLGLGDLRDEPLSTCLTKLATDICAPDSDTELSTALIQCSLLTRDRPDLALDLAAFCDRDPFSTYVQGRVFLSLKDFEAAATYFKKAAYGMSVKTKHVDRHSSGLLDDTEWNMLNNGLPHYYGHIVTLYDKSRAYSHVADFAQLALRFCHGVDSSPIQTEMLSRLFTASTNLSQFEISHSVLLMMADRALQRSCLRKLVERMCETSRTTDLISLPFPGLQDIVDEALLQKCDATKDVIRGTPYHQILYAWRISRNDYRGAATIILDRIEKLRQVGEGERMIGEDILDTPVTCHYIMLINALNCVEPRQAWVFAEDRSLSDPRAEIKRRVVTLADVRKQYQDELDRIAAIQNNQFGFELDDGQIDVGTGVADI